MSTTEFNENDWRRLLETLGEDPSRPGLVETPSRVAKAWQHWTSGYGQEPAEILKVFEDGAEEYNELIMVRNIPVYSHCEHHLAPFFGTATIGYTPNGRIVGLSKLTRLMDCFAKRLQVQERLTIQVANALMEHLQPKSVGVMIRCRHMCMESRGIRTPGEETVTSALLGELQTNLALRTEFLSLARG
ncbi:GTP cyclohydrolase I FolE [Pigmentiphaga aceris]|uniref:GTP cyclohydrolase 1 n=1 Tax=Pigmentiphaga aceris TaxID=1940612 RepID=A0A5C0AZH2_9BURK|nr:GTP cyclohydrolase I FolE [Pigmentiphaga aceris]QEI07004.1 GTP cyclohydrolase I FolE [Pigmentiphaga aceris]